MIQYKTVDTNTLEGLKHAERLYATGWKMGRVGLFTTQFYRSAPTRTLKSRPIKTTTSKV